MTKINSEDRKLASKEEFLERASNLFELLKLFDEPDQVDLLNQTREMLHESGPFSSEPVDFVKWVAAEDVYANDYNPNAVAPPEMELLALSIMSDGYTQPIVTWPTEKGCEVVDGFHRNRVGKENEEVKAKLKGYLPVVGINPDRTDKNDRVASTIRHNRARGKHKVSAMSDIVLDLKRRNWSPKKIGKELGMDQDEVLRLVQVTGLAEMFKDSEFSEAWEVAEDISPVLEMGGGENEYVGEDAEQEYLS